jgi:hypothetical protein
VAILVSTVLLARSPASALAIVKEVGAQGPFTTICLGVAILADVVIIIVFGLNIEIARSMLLGSSFKWISLLVPLQKITISLALGWATAMIIAGVLKVLPTVVALCSRGNAAPASSSSSSSSSSLSRKVASSSSPSAANWPVRGFVLLVGLLPFTGELFLVIVVIFVFCMCIRQRSNVMNIIIKSSGLNTLSLSLLSKRGAWRCVDVDNLFSSIYF